MRQDLDPEEEEIFSNLVESVLTTTLYKGSQRWGGAYALCSARSAASVPPCGGQTTKHEHSVEFWFGKMGNLSPLGVGQVYGQRNSRTRGAPQQCKQREVASSGMLHHGRP